MNLFIALRVFSINISNNVWIFAIVFDAKKTGLPTQQSNGRENEIKHFFIVCFWHGCYFVEFAYLQF